MCFLGNETKTGTFVDELRSSFFVIGWHFRIGSLLMKRWPTVSFARRTMALLVRSEVSDEGEEGIVSDNSEEEEQFPFCTRKGLSSSPRRNP